MSSTGLEGIAVVETRLSRVLGDEGRLTYAGYAIEDLARNASFENVSHLLWTGQLPEPGEAVALRSALVESGALDARLLDIVRLGATRAHPMSTLQAVLAAAAFFDPESEDSSAAADLRKAIRLTATAVTASAAIGRLRNGLEPVAPRAELGLAAGFLFMLHGGPAREEHADMLDTAFVLHAEHGMNPSTFAGRVAAATRSDLHAAVAAAVGTLKGPLHGGAPEAVVRMLRAVERPERAREWVLTMLSRGDRVPGFGHRVYRTRDPRVPILRDIARRLSTGGGVASGTAARLLPVAEAIERVMAEEMERRDKAVHPNVDLFSAVVYSGLGIPPELYANMFACARMPGCTAHIMEQRSTNRLIWPSASYVGPADRRTGGDVGTV